MPAHAADTPKFRGRRSAADRSRNRLGARCAHPLETDGNQRATESSPVEPWIHGLFCGDSRPRGLGESGRLLLNVVLFFGTELPARCRIQMPNLDADATVGILDGEIVRGDPSVGNIGVFLLLGFGGIVETDGLAIGLGYG